MKKKILLIYTELGFSGTYLVQAPISLVYVASKIVSIPDLEIEILDCRIESDWRDRLEKIIKEDNVLLAGFFVMSGLQVAKAYDATHLIKSLDQDIPIIWGGPHPTILPEEVLDYGGVDFCVRGFGTDAFTELVQKLLTGNADYEAIPNLCFQKGEEMVIGEINAQYERVNYKELPYYLLDEFVEKYFENTKSRAFPIYTAFGCPYLCNFCISPIWFKDTNKKWDPLPPEEVADHIEYLMKRYDINFIYFWDDDTFVSPRHFSAIARELIKRNLNVQIGVRGIRANEVTRMKLEDFNLMNQVGVRFLHIGLENGSQRILDLMQKGIDVEQSLEANRKLSKINTIVPMYNMLCGVPTETVQDLEETGKFMLRLVEENPNCIIYAPNKLVPYPGGEAFKIAVENGYIAPKSPEDWKVSDQEGEIYQPWYTPTSNQYIRMLQLSTYAISNWERYLTNYPLWLRILYRVLKSIYKPIAKFRLSYCVSDFLIEYPLFCFARKIMTKGGET